MSKTVDSASSPKDQPVDELKQILGEKTGDGCTFMLPYDKTLARLTTYVQAECNRARIEEVTLMEECVDDFQGYAKDRIAELQQLMKEGE